MKPESTICDAYGEAVANVKRVVSKLESDKFKLDCNHSITACPRFGNF